MLRKAYKIRFANLTNKANLLNTWGILSKAGLCSKQQPEAQQRKGSSKGTARSVFRFKTYTFPYFNGLHSAFYLNGVKVVPRNIALFLTPQALATWIMDDGTWLGYSLKLATDSFTYEQQLVLVSALWDSLGLKANINKAGFSKAVNQVYNVVILAESVSKLRSLVLPYFVPEMTYKLGL